MYKAFEILDVAGDVGLSVSGVSLKEIFTNAAIGLYHLITPSKVETEETIEVAISGMDIENLLVKWLNELIFIFDAQGFIGNFIDFKNLSETELTAEVRGGFFDREKCEQGLLVKAATYHGLEIKKEDGLYRVKIIFDI